MNRERAAEGWRLGDLERRRSTGLLLNDRRPLSNDLALGDVPAVTLPY